MLGLSGRCASPCCPWQRAGGWRRPQPRDKGLNPMSCAASSSYPRRAPCHAGGLANKPLLTCSQTRALPRTPRPEMHLLCRHQQYPQPYAPGMRRRGAVGQDRVGVAEYTNVVPRAWLAVMQDKPCNSAAFCCCLLLLLLLPWATRHTERPLPQAESSVAALVWPQPLRAPLQVLYTDQKGTAHCRDQNQASSPCLVTSKCRCTRPWDRALFGERCQTMASFTSCSMHR